MATQRADRWLLATHNTGKLEELQVLLQDLDIDLVGAGELKLPVAEENGRTFIENALHKAREGAAASGLPAIADDSGLAVDALGGAPGIYSARYAGSGASDSDNVERLLAELKGLDAEQRAAQFVCVLVAVRHVDDPIPLVAQGEWRGRITESPRGHGGFGYDPVFWVPERRMTAAELPVGEKNRISHRALAAEVLKELLGRGRD